MLTSRYELQHTPSDEALATAERDGYLATADISYYLNPNARVGLDYARTASNHETSRGWTNPRPCISATGFRTRHAREGTC